MNYESWRGRISAILKAGSACNRRRRRNGIGRELPPVSVENEVAAGKGAHQHQQRGFGQVEICEQGVDGAELIRWINEDVRGTALRDNLTAGRGAALEDAQSCGANGEDSLCGADGGGGLRGRFRIAPGASCDR